MIEPERPDSVSDATRASSVGETFIFTITRRNGDAHSVTVDAADRDLVEARTWCIHATPTPGLYYVQSSRRYGRVYLQRLLTAAPPGLQVDHVDGDGLNNRRKNLRLVTPAEQAQNMRAYNRRSVNPSSFRGVVWDKGKWRAHIRVAGKRQYLGRFMNELDAARAAQEARRKHFPFTNETRHPVQAAPDV